MSEQAAEAVRRWRRFATSVYVNWNGDRRTWAEHISGAGYGDEKRVIQPIVFPAFAEAILGFGPLDLAAEDSAAVDDSSKPDFTPADSVTHQFVFETKGSSEGIALSGHNDQVLRYLTQGKSRIRWVVLTNLVGIRVVQLNALSGALEEYMSVNLKGLLNGFEDIVAGLPDAERLARFVEQFSREDLSGPLKLDRVKTAPPWNPVVEATSSKWILGRVDKVVQLLTSDVRAYVLAGVLTDPSKVMDEEQRAILEEIQGLAARLGVENPDSTTLQAFLSASPGSDRAKAVEQFCAHTAYFTATRLLLVRIWEDLELLAPMLHDGGFREQMIRFDDVVSAVVAESFNNARSRYRSLFERNNNYTWYQPSEETYVDVIYQIANTYLGDIQSDILGEVYERLLDRIDRKLLGQYYTPRDIIGLIWDLIDLDAAADDAEAQGRPPRILDIATGSGGFLVEAATRLRARKRRLEDAGASIPLQQWLILHAEALNGVEFQRFSAYLAELNLLVQFGQAAAGDPHVSIPSLAILMADTLSLYEPTDDYPAPLPSAISAERPVLAERLSNALGSGLALDIACGNPPYIGEKLAAPMLARTREQFPYWNQFVAPHPDYLYNFLIVGVSKLRPGGRFGFITTEYWLRAEGATPLRRLLAEQCAVERIVLFRDLRLFPDAPGQHSMVVTGHRLAESDGNPPPVTRPVVSIYEGPSIPRPADRAKVLQAMRDAKTFADVRTFNAQVSPGSLGSASWIDCTLTRTELRRRKKLLDLQQIPLLVSKGVETTLNRDSSQTTSTGASGIQLLKQREVDGLGTLTPAERAVLRKVINTKDVYPYAAIVPDDVDSVIYLSKPANPSGFMPDQFRELSFPAGMPTLRAHLEEWRPVLLEATRSRGENRPWWTLHRSRANVLGGTASGDWESYALTARWGGGQRLVVGLAPAGSSPASGLHVLRPDADSVSAAYLTAIYNSAAYQLVAASLPPGQLRQADLVALGLPYLKDEVDALSSLAVSLAEKVTGLMHGHSAAFPMLGDLLRAEVSLASPPVDCWHNPYDDGFASGALQSVHWVEEVTRSGPATTAIGRVTAFIDVFGPSIGLHARSDDRQVVTIRLRHEAASTQQALASLIRGRLATGTSVGQISRLSVPVDPHKLDADWANARAALMVGVTAYRDDRAAIEELLAQHLQ